MRTALPLTLASPYLPPREDGRPWLLRGAIDLTARVHPASGGWRGNVHLTSASGGLRNSERSRRDLVAYDHLVLDADFDPQRVDATPGDGARRQRPHRCAHRHGLGCVRAAGTARSRCRPMR